MSASQEHNSSKSSRPSRVGPPYFEEKWEREHDTAAQYMKAARWKPSPDSSRGDIQDESLPENASMRLFSREAKEALSIGMQLTEDSLHKCQKFKDFDDDSKKLYQVAERVFKTLQKLDNSSRNSSRGKLTSGNILYDLNSGKPALRRLIDRSMNLMTDNRAVEPKSHHSLAAVSHLRGGNFRNSFRQRIDGKLVNASIELLGIISFISDTLNPEVFMPPSTAQNGQASLGTRHPLGKPSESGKPLQSFANHKLIRTSSARFHRRPSYSTTCSDCLELFEIRESWSINPDKIQFQPQMFFKTSMDKLFQAADNGCHFCRIQLARLLERANKDPNSKIWGIKGAEVQWWKHWNSENVIDVNQGRSSSQIGKDFEIRYIDKNGEALPGDYYITKNISKDEVARSVGASTSSNESLNVAKSWIKTCLDSHELCNSQTRKHVCPPTRLIFIGTAEDKHARIIESQDTACDLKYMTLSHRWADHNLIHLTTVNYLQFTKRMDLTQLPQSFIDAIEVVRRLGVYYLWIDCLCIIQDSEADWERESYRMSEIYTGSWCNIAATGAIDNLHGLYTKRDPMDIKGCIMSTKTPGSMFRVHLDCYGSNEWENAVSSSPLMGRGWVLQEVTLAPRTLYFAYDRLYWQCSMQKSSEDAPLELHTDRMRYYEDPGPENEDDETEFHGPRGWAALVHKYSRCKLTFPAKDKLVAISGIARSFGPAEDYLAGLWRKDLVLQLAWRAFGGKPRPTEYQAPSWSWASTNNEVKYIINTSVIPASMDGFDRILEGVIRLQGPLLKLRNTGYTVTALTADWWGTTRRTYIDLHSAREFTILSGQKEMPVDLDYEDETEPDEILYCMPLYYERERDIGNYGTVHGIVLQPTGRERGEFYRRGTVFLGDKSAGGAWIIDQFTRYCQDSASEISEDAFESRDEAKDSLPVFTITLV
ncbi:hypothetical protein BP5796_00768 [Coleophoma crateriformis]|uniref:Heterokaryon incompatibility domain-containing protein n=1 Tax=Coleophoma crateriformis TaxID=565419 RepID=A0A3D8T8Z9_9HELO|nr:hypothetical protein BP5796_00768 [Coleophoma crateriformis]